MRYLSFEIQDYRAIEKPLKVDISKKTLIPIIGINECGKTTVLNGIFAFDEMSDSWNQGRHLKNYHNLYSTERPPALIRASIEISLEELKDAIKEVENNSEIPQEEKKGLHAIKRRISELKTTIIIERNLETKKYKIGSDLFNNYQELSHHLGSEIVRRCPYILYFDDFTESIDDQIEIKKNEDESLSPWLSIIEQLFKTTNSSYSVFKLKEMEELHRKSVISDITKRLNKTLADEWSRFSLEDRSVLNVAIDYKPTEGSECLSIQIKEIIDGNERFFGIRDRSKGFFWFFNFVMKLEFNPKVRDLEDRDTIYLLDEPGSYLHANAQSRLCEKLSALSKNNVVIYCTHSHYLLNPDQVPINSVQIVEKNEYGSISMKTIAEAEGKIKEKRGAFQPLLDALQIKPLIFDYNKDNGVLVEGIYDYYVFELFKDSGERIKKLNFFPGVDAHSINYNISFSIFGGVKYLAMWDNDEEGKKEFERAKIYFGEKEAEKFFVLPSLTKRKSYKLENIFDLKDLKLITRELSLPNNTSFEKIIISLFFAPKQKRSEILQKISDVTQKRIKFVYDTILSKFDPQYEKKVFDN